MGQEQSESIERWKAKCRANLVLQILKGEISIAEAARWHGLTVAEVEGGIGTFNTIFGYSKRLEETVGWQAG